MVKGSLDLGKLPLQELRAMQADLEREIGRRLEEERERVISQVRELAASIGTTPEALFGGGGREEKPKGRTRRSPAAKYRHPEDPALTWSGRGRKPVWVTEALESGKSLEDLAVR